MTVQFSTSGHGSDAWQNERSAPAQILHLPKLSQLHVTLRYDLNYYDEYEEEENERWFQQCDSLAVASQTLGSLELWKCVYEWPLTKIGDTRGI